jgi:hypothetical protein
VPDSEQDVANNEDSTAPPRQLGGITGKGFMPGQSGNPSGRPKRKPLSDAYSALLGQTVPPEIARQLRISETSTYAEVVAMALLKEAVKGKVNAAAELADRVEGRVMERVQVDHRGDPLAELLSEFKREYDEIPKADTPDAHT